MTVTLSPPTRIDLTRHQDSAVVGFSHDDSEAALLQEQQQQEQQKEPHMKW